VILLEVLYITIIHHIPISRGCDPIYWTGAYAYGRF